MTKLPTMREHKNALIAEAFRLAGGNAVEAAKIIQVGANTVYRWQRKKAACHFGEEVA